MNKAIKTNNLEEVTRLYKEDPKRHYGGCELQYRAIHLAAMAGKTHIVYHLYKMDNLCLSARDINGWSPLIHAVRAGRWSTVQIMLPYDKTQIHLMDDLGMTPLHHAAITGNVFTAKILLKYDREAVAWTDMYGRTPAFWAVFKGHADMTCMLFKLDPEALTRRDKKGKTVVHVAAHWEQHALVPLLHELGCDLDAQDNYGWTPMHVAAASGDEKTMRALHDAGSKAHFAKNEDGHTPVDVARTDKAKSFFHSLCSAITSD